MTISELILELEKLKESDGDIQVEYADHEWGGSRTIGAVYVIYGAVVIE